MPQVAGAGGGRARAVVYAPGMATRATSTLLAIGAVLLGGVTVGVSLVGPVGADPAPAAAVSDPDWLAKLIARTDEIAAKVATVRGLKLLRPIDKGVVDDDQLRARIVARMDEDSPPAKRALEAAAAKRWGLVPWATDLDQLLIDLLTEQIAGFYDPRERKLYIASSRESEPTWADMVMAHEIDHALQDQHFDLDRWMKAAEGDDDASAARAAVVEGDGVALMIEYSLAEQGLPPPWGQEMVVRMMLASMAATAAGGGDGGGGDGGSGGGDGARKVFDRAPLALREQLIFPYQAGVGFIAAVRKTQPWARVDDVFTKRPPASTEQILHPELYVADLRPDRITEGAPPASSGLVQLHAAIWGEAGWGTFLRSPGVVAATAATAAAGWGGDRVVLLGPADGAAHPERTTALALTTWDSEVDAAEAWDALGQALDAMVVGAPLVADDHQVRWLGADGRITLAERRGDRIAIVVAAPLWSWRALAEAAWSWKVKPATKTP